MVIYIWSVSHDMIQKRRSPGNHLAPSTRRVLCAAHQWHKRLLTANPSDARRYRADRERILLEQDLHTSRNQVAQELLNLIMFYHNHRRYRAGKRAGNTSMELFTGQPQER